MVGIILVNKPAGVSSYHVIARIKKLVNIKRAKVGHAGTLDPFATGLLVVGIGREATRLLSQITMCDKTYSATGLLGERTDTLDCAGTVIQVCPWEHITKEQLGLCCDSLVGPYEQIPPIYSALQYQGKRLYNLARKEHVPTDVLHEIAAQKKRMISVYNCALISTQLPQFDVHFHVSHGTYIRVLVNELAQRLGSCATTINLKRTAIGDFKSSDAIELKDLDSIETLQERLLSVDKVIQLLADKSS